MDLNQSKAENKCRRCACFDFVFKFSSLSFLVNLQSMKCFQLETLTLEKRMYQRLGRPMSPRTQIYHRRIIRYQFFLLDRPNKKKKNMSWIQCKCSEDKLTSIVETYFFLMLSKSPRSRGIVKQVNHCGLQNTDTENETVKQFCQWYFTWNYSSQGVSNLNCLMFKSLIITPGKRSTWHKVDNPRGLTRV